MLFFYLNHYTSSKSEKKMRILAAALLLLVADIDRPFVMTAHIPSPPTPTNTVAAADTEKVLVAIGGSAYGAGSGGYNDVETISLTTNKHYHAVPSAYVMEGTANVLVGDTVYYLGTGHDSSGMTAYNVTDNSWLGPTGVFPDYPDQVGFGSQAAEVNGSIIVLGGQTLQFTYATSVNAYRIADGANGKWTLMGRVPATSSWPCALTVNGSIFYIAGREIHRSDDSGKTWNMLRRMDEKCGQVRVACAAIDNYRILVSGGRAAGDPSATTDRTYLYDISKNKWNSNLPGMQSGREGHSAVLIPSEEKGRNDILVCGGYQGDDNSVDSEATSACEYFDTKLNVWKSSQFQMEHGRSLFGLFVGNAPVRT